MTEQEVYNLYGVEFINKVMKFNTGKQIVKKASVADGSLFRFLNDWNCVQEINESLLPTIENALNNPTIEETSDSNTEWVELNYHTTKIWYTGNPYNEHAPDFSLPTQHFKTIVLGWRNFLLTPPLNNKKVTFISDLKDRIFYFFLKRG